MSLSVSEIAAVVRELQPLVGSRVEAVRVYAERALTLDLYGRSGSVVLLISAEPEITRIHLTGGHWASPERPYALQAQLRKEIESSRLIGIEAVAGDRIVMLRLEKGTALLSLVAELTGRHGNLVLVAADRRIQAVAVRQLTLRRRLVPGERYVAPPSPQPFPRPAQRGEGRGEGQPSTRPPHPNPPGGEGRSRGSGAAAAFPLSSAIDSRYRAIEEERTLSEARRRLREPLRAAWARTRRALEKLAEDAARVPAAETDRRIGDLIKVNLHLLRRGASEVWVTEYTADGPRQTQLHLDPALSPHENMERYYRRSRRIVESAARVEERAREMRSREQALADLLKELELTAIEELLRIEREARRLGVSLRPAGAPRRQRPARALPFRQFQSLTGAAILAGRGAAENDTLTTRFARGNDLWLHVRGRPGAHVILRLGRGQGPDQESLLDAAHLAAHFSDARGETAPEVVYTRVKYVSKPRGAGPGAVIYSQERTLVLRLEAQRLERLLASESSESDGAKGTPR